MELQTGHFAVTERRSLSGARCQPRPRFLANHRSRQHRQHRRLPRMHHDNLVEGSAITSKLIHGTKPLQDAPTRKASKSVYDAIHEQNCVTNHVCSSNSTSNNHEGSSPYQPSATIRDYAAVATQNSKFRKYMEDECVVIPNFSIDENDTALNSFFAVFDGHGGNFCSRYAASHMHNTFSAILSEVFQRKWKQENGKMDAARTSDATSSSSLDMEADLLTPCDIRDSFARAYASIDAKLVQDEEAATCGSTAVTCMVRKYQGETWYHVANVGDSRAILYSNGVTRRLSVDHKATFEEEAARIRAANGIIFNKRVGGVVSVSRALGQADEKAFIISTPHSVSGIVETTDSFMVLSSDGVSDVFTDEEVSEFVHNRLEKGARSVSICKSLLEASKSRGAVDNMTVVIICLADPKADGKLKTEYDRGVNTFSPEGRIYQVEYAIEAIKMGTTAIGIRTKEGIVLAVEKRLTSPLLEPESIEKVMEIDRHVGAAMSGITSDAQILIDHARVEATNHWFSYNDKIRVQALTQSICDLAMSFGEGQDENKHKQKMSRPFGVALLVAGVDEEGPHLFYSEPSGLYFPVQAHAIGSGAEGASTNLKEGFSEDMSLKDAENLAISALKQHMEEKLSNINVEVAVVTPEKGFHVCTREELDVIINRI